MHRWVSARSTGGAPCRVPHGWTPFLPGHPRCPLSQGSWLPGRPLPAPPPPTLLLPLRLQLGLGLLVHLLGGHTLLSPVGCCIPSWHVVSSNSERRLKFSRYYYHSCRRRCRFWLFAKRPESERKGNWLFEKHSTYSGGFRKAFGECSRRIRCDIKPNETFELHSERNPIGCGKHSPKITSSSFGVF